MRYAIRKAVTIPPQKMPSHIYGCPPWLVSHEKKTPQKKGQKERKKERKERVIGAKLRTLGLVI